MEMENEKLFLSEDALLTCREKWDVCTNRVINYHIVSSDIKFHVSMDGRNSFAVCSVISTSQAKWANPKLFHSVNLSLLYRKTNFNHNLRATKANLHTRMEPWRPLSTFIYDCRCNKYLTPSWLLFLGDIWSEFSLLYSRVESSTQRFHNLCYHTSSFHFIFLVVSSFTDFNRLTSSSRQQLTKQHKQPSFTEKRRFSICVSCPSLR